MDELGGLMKRIAANMKARREGLELTQQQAADRAGVGNTAWSKYENAASPWPPSLRTLSKLAKALECDVIDLLAKPNARK